MSDAQGFELIVETATLQQTVDDLRSLVDEAIWTFGEEELFAGSPDPANAAMAHETIHREAFEHYHASGMEMGFNLERLDDYLGEIDAEMVELSWDAETGQMAIDSDRVHINMAGIDPDTVRNQGEIPEVKDNLPVVLTVEAGALDHAIGLADMVSDHVDLQTDPDREFPFHVIAVGDTDDVDIDFGAAIITADYGEACESKFSIDYLKDLLQPIPTDAEVTLRHGEEFPVVLEWSHADGHADVTMMHAPRIDST